MKNGAVEGIVCKVPKAILIETDNSFTTPIPSLFLEDGVIAEVDGEKRATLSLVVCELQTHSAFNPLLYTLIEVKSGSLIVDGLTLDGLTFGERRRLLTKPL